MRFGGRWGETIEIRDLGGPIGPSHKGEQWDDPQAWGTSQPLDLDLWYANRLRVDVLGAEAQIGLASERPSIAQAVEFLSGSAILHADLAQDEVLSAAIQAPPNKRFDLTAQVPSPSTGQVNRYLFRGVTTGPSGKADLAIRVGEAPVFFAEGGTPNWPNSVETEDALWDAPDVAWMAQTISTWDLLKGLGISWVVGVVPALVLLALLYYADRYEKEPARLVLSAFFWGAWPAFLIGLAVVLIFRLPIELWGRDAVEAVRFGVLAPAIEELLKGAVLLFIVYRFRYEIDSIHDGIIYGAAVGLGFAMTANMMSFMGAFLVSGYEEMERKIFVEGFLHGLNHAFYSAIFGAGLAYAVLARDTKRRWAVPLAALLAAIAANGIHKVILRNTIGVNPISIGLTWLGALVVFALMFWSLRQQHFCIDRELAGEVPDDLRRTLLRPDARAWAEARALRQAGWRGWRRTRTTFQLCAELAFRKAQSAAHADQPDLAQEVERLRQELQACMTTAAWMPGSAPQ